jgi:WD40 repeat protein
MIVPHNQSASKILTLLVVFWSTASTTAVASDLYSHDSPWLSRYDSTKAEWKIVGSTSLNTSIEDLSYRPGDMTYLYALENSRENGLSESRIVKINRHTGRQSYLPFSFDKAALGFSEVFSTGIAISPLTPSIAVVIGFDAGYATSSTYGQRFLWHANTNTGEVIGGLRPIPRISSPLTYDPSGTVLYAADIEGRIITIDESTGIFTIVGDPMLSSFIEGLAFRPEDGTLFAINGYSIDQLVTLDSGNGFLQSVVSDLPFGGMHGLAFMPSIPEPSSAALTVLGMASISVRRLSAKWHCRAAR